MCMCSCRTFDYFRPQLIIVISNCCQLSVGFHQYELPSAATAERLFINYCQCCHAVRHFADNFVAFACILLSQPSAVTNSSLIQQNVSFIIFFMLRDCCSLISFNYCKCRIYYCSNCY